MSSDDFVSNYLRTMLPPELSLVPTGPPPSPLFTLLLQYDALMADEKTDLALDLADGKAVSALFAAVRTEEDMLRATHAILSRLRTPDQLSPFHKLLAVSFSQKELDAVLALSDVNDVLSYFTTDAASDPVRRFGAVAHTLLVTSSCKH